MTAHALGSTPPTPPATRNASSGAAQEAAAPGHFDQQLHAARQRSASRDVGSGDGRDHAPLPRAPNARGAEAKLDPQNGARPDATQACDPRLPAAPAPNAVPAVVSAAVLSVAGDGTAGGEQASTETGNVDDQGAAALAGAMLALIGPAVAGVLRPAAAAEAAAAQAGKATATDNLTAMLLPGAAAATANPAPAAMAGILAATDGLLPIAAKARDAASNDAPSVALTAPSAAAAPAAPTVLSLPSPVGSHAFAQELGQQVAWLGGQDIKQARIRLHPEELGSLDVKISVTHGRVDVVFSAQHPGAAAAVQQSLPQLDHMLAQHGLSLGHAEVGQHDHGGRHGHGADREAAALDDAGEIHGVSMTTPLRQIGLLDAFA